MYLGSALFFLFEVLGFVWNWFGVFLRIRSHGIHHHGIHHTTIWENMLLPNHWTSKSINLDGMDLVSLLFPFGKIRLCFFGADQTKQHLYFLGGCPSVHEMGCIIDSYITHITIFTMRLYIYCILYICYMFDLHKIPIGLGHLVRFDVWLYRDLQ